MIRLPDRYRDPSPERHRKKWDGIILAFRQGDLEKLFSIQRTGARGRIFYCLVEEMLHLLSVEFRVEPIFEHVSPNPWYVDFALKHGLKLRLHSFYNPDFFFENGAWLEVTLSENSAYKKIFTYGHQSEELFILWLDPDQGFHRSVCLEVEFPNAQIKRVQSFFDHLGKTIQGENLIKKFELLSNLKGTLL